MTGGAERPFALSAAQERLVGEVRELAREVLVPLAAAGRPGRVNRGLVRALGEHGLLGRVLPAAPDGRGGASAMELCLLREALARESTEAETALALQGLGGYPVAVWGSSGVRGRLLPELVAGRAVAAFALSEPAAGSDAGGLELRAEPDGDGFRLSGTKAWISNAPEADVYTLFARTTPGGPVAGDHRVRRARGRARAGWGGARAARPPRDRAPGAGRGAGRARAGARAGRPGVRGGHGHPGPVPAQRGGVRGRDGPGGAGRGRGPRRRAAGVRAARCASSRRWPTPWPRRPPGPRRPGCWSTRRPAATTPTRPLPG